MVALQPSRPQARHGAPHHFVETAAKEKACYDAVKELLYRSNAPHNVQSVINNTCSQFTKTFIDKALTRLVEEGKAEYVEVGKSGKLYVWNQKLLQVLSPEELKAVQDETETLQKQLDKANEDLATLREAVQQLEQRPTEEELVARVQKAKEKMEALSKELQQYEDVPTITEDQVTKAKAKLKKDFKTWSDRRATVAEMAGNLAEGMEKKLKDIRETIGIDEGADKTEMRNLLSLLK